MPVNRTLSTGSTPTEASPRKPDNDVCLYLGVLLDVRDRASLQQLTGVSDQGFRQRLPQLAAASLHDARSQASDTALLGAHGRRMKF